MIGSYSAHAESLIEYKISSLALKQSQTVQVSLPTEFSNTKRYPIIYVLNTHDFYAGDFSDDVLHRIRQLEGYNQIPNTIIVLINHDSWYSLLFNQAEQLTQFITSELPDFISQKYKTRERHLFAYSYGGAYLLSNSVNLQSHYDQLYAISAVFPDVSYVQNIANSLAKLDDKKAKVTLFQEQGHLADTQFFNTKNLDGTVFKQQIIAEHSHQSILPVALSDGLRYRYKDYAVVDYLSQLNLSKAELSERFISIRRQYTLSAEKADLQSFYSEMAQSKMAQEQLPLAFELWRAGSPRFRHYFINQWGERFLAQGKLELAQFTWQQLSKLYPYSPFAWHKLSKLAVKMNNAKVQKVALQQLADAINHFTIDDHALIMAFVMQHDATYPQLSIRALERITLQMPKHKQAWQRLHHFYKSQGKEALSNKAKQALSTL
nr:alpha/beta hydrolase-fold protein [Pseudoalteromonas sp. MMG013]